MTIVDPNSCKKKQTCSQSEQKCVLTKVWQHDTYHRTPLTFIFQWLEKNWRYIAKPILPKSEPLHHQPTLKMTMISNSWIHLHHCFWHALFLQQNSIYKACFWSRNSPSGLVLEGWDVLVSGQHTKHVNYTVFLIWACKKTFIFDGIFLVFYDPSCLPYKCSVFININLMGTVWVQPSFMQTCWRRFGIRKQNLKPRSLKWRILFSTVTLRPRYSHVLLAGMWSAASWRDAAAVVCWWFNERLTEGMWFSFFIPLSRIKRELSISITDLPAEDPGLTVRSRLLVFSGNSFENFPLGPAVSSL